MCGVRAHVRGRRMNSFPPVCELSGVCLNYAHHHTLQSINLHRILLFSNVLDHIIIIISKRVSIGVYFPWEIQFSNIVRCTARTFWTPTAISFCALWCSNLNLRILQRVKTLTDLLRGSSLRSGCKPRT